MQFFLPMQPPRTTAQTHQVDCRSGKPRFYKPEALQAAEQKFRAALAPHAPGEPLQGPVRLVVKWVWFSKDPKLQGRYKQTKPDTDNLQKLLKDVMGFIGFWLDDAQVVSEITEKFWGDVPGIFIQVEEIR